MSSSDGPALTASEIAAKIGVEPATKIGGGVRVAHHAPHPHTDKSTEQSEAEEKKLKDKQDHDALALSNQVAEIQSLHTGSVQQELLKGSSKATAATYHHPPQPAHLDNHNIRGEHQRQTRQITQPSGKNGHNNFGH